MVESSADEWLVESNANQSLIGHRADQWLIESNADQWFIESAANQWLSRIGLLGSIRVGVGLVFFGLAHSSDPRLSLLLSNNWKTSPHQLLGKNLY